MEIRNVWTRNTNLNRVSNMIIREHRSPLKFDDPIIGEPRDDDDEYDDNRLENICQFFRYKCINCEAAVLQNAEKDRCKNDPDRVVPCQQCHGNTDDTGSLGEAQLKVVLVSH